MNTRGITYAFPYYAIFFAGILLLIFFMMYRAYRRQKSLEAIAPFPLLGQYLVARSPLAEWIKGTALVVGWLCAVIALMGPRGNGHYPANTLPNGPDQQRAPLEVTFFVDASASMSVQDTREGTSRLEMAKEVVDQMVRYLLGNNVSLYAFTAQASQLSPPTLDELFVRLVLSEIHINEGDVAGTDFVKVLQQVNKEHPPMHAGVARVWVIISDGGDTLWEVSQGPQKAQRLQDIVQQVTSQDTSHLRVFTVGIGSKQGGNVPDVTFQGKPVHSALDSEVLEALSHAGNGIYYDSNLYSSLALATDFSQAIQKFASSLPPVSSNAPENLLEYSLYFQIPLGIAILCLCILLFFPETILSHLFIGLLCFAFPLQADEGQEAQEYVEAGEYSQALKIYADLLEQHKTGIEPLLLNYNMGTVYLYQGHDKDALREFEWIAMDKQTPGFLKKWLNTNQAIAGLHLALEDKDLLEKFFLYREALKDLNQAEDSYPAREMKAYAKQAINQIMQQNQQVGFGDFEDLYALLIRLKNNQTSVQLFEKEKIPGKRLTEYLDYFIHSNADVHLIKNAQVKTTYEQAFAAIKERNWAEASQKLEQAIQLVERLLSQTKPDLQSLKNGYLLALISDPLLGPLLQMLQIQQDNFLKGLSPENGFQKLSQLLDQAAAFFKNDQPLQSRLFLQAGLLTLNEAQRQSAGLQPKDLLNWALDDQLYALKFLWEAGENNIHGEKVDLLLKSLQASVMKTADLFLPEVYKWQVKGYDQNKCQCNPWNQVLPQFDKGKKAASQALHALADKKFDAAMQGQVIALQRWRDALKLLQNPPPEQAPKQSPIQPEKLTTPETFQTLQKMQQMDQLPQGTQKAKVEEGRAW